ncbi:MAG: TetR/AcrR family transcriptional regulator [Clostridiales bacterium]|nr:TetR/AcrR family transcriptional regulator [Clostridiales bacterium]
MPSERFYRLSAAKQQRIKEAVMKEFARVPFEKVSINQIVQTAGISRGSFYTYFNDKNDLVRWLLEDTRDQMQYLMNEEMSRQDGDYFSMLKIMFESAVSAMKNEEIFSVYRNIFSSQECLRQGGMDMMPSVVRMYEEGSPIRRIYEHVDKHVLRLERYEDFIPVALQAGTAMMIYLKQYYEHPDSLTEIRRLFHQSLDILRYGAYKKEEEKRRL